MLLHEFSAPQQTSLVLQHAHDLPRPHRVFTCPPRTRQMPLSPVAAAAAATVAGRVRRVHRKRKVAR
eukprot:5041595-Amphidinium_carterae.1